MNKNALLRHIDAQTKFDTVWQLAEFCGITVPQLVDVTKGSADEKLTNKVAKALEYKDISWNIDRSTTNYKTVKTVFDDAKSEGMWFCISSPAGSGKSETIEDLYSNDTTGSVKMITAEQWHARQFLCKLVERLYGITSLDKGDHRGRRWDETGTAYKNTSYFLDLIVTYFNSCENPILVIDEADKLRDSALCMLIPLFNRTQDRLAVILSGTDALQKRIRSGVRHSKTGYDEIESRFGRNYIVLRGSSYADVAAICKANGITNDESIEMIWSELPKVEKLASIKTEQGKKERMVPFVEDMRRLKRLIKRELLISKRRAA